MWVIFMFCRRMLNTCILTHRFLPLLHYSSNYSAMSCRSFVLVVSLSQQHSIVVLRASLSPCGAPPPRPPAFVVVALPEYVANIGAVDKWCDCNHCPVMCSFVMLVGVVSLLDPCSRPRRFPCSSARVLLRYGRLRINCQRFCCYGFTRTCLWGVARCRSPWCGLRGISDGGGGGG
jgi:hypothetical protein